MTVLVAPDKFKGSLTARQVVEHLGRGLADRGVAYRGLPLADGGDGSVAAAIDAGFSGVEVTAAGPTGQPRRALVALDGRTAVVEVAGTSGLAALPDGILEPLRSSTRGVGLPTPSTSTGLPGKRRRTHVHDLGAVETSGTIADLYVPKKKASG